MVFDITEFVEFRTSEIAEELREKNGIYALAEEASRFFYDVVDPIVQSETDLIISAGDCAALRDYFIQEQKAASLLQQEIYCQGVRDGAGLLRTLGLL